jgi:thymidine phosphorylase
MQTKADARKLAQAMVALGNQCGVNTRAILTDMNTPVGRAAGNWLEVKESVACLEGKGPEDLHKLVVVAAAHLLMQTRKARSLNIAMKLAADCLRSGEPRRKWDEMLQAQGADLAAFDHKLTRDHTAPVVMELQAKKSGYLSRCDARIIAEVIRDLGGGRLTKESVINFDVGIDQLAKPGALIQKNATLCRIHATDFKQAQTARNRLARAFESSPRPVKPVRLISEVIT